MNIETVRQYFDTEKAIIDRCSLWTVDNIDRYGFDFDKNVIKIQATKFGFIIQYVIKIPLDKFLTIDTKQEAERLKEEWSKEAEKKRLKKVEHKKDVIDKQKKRLDKFYGRESK